MEWIGCDECCGKRDEKELKEMQIGSKICLYLANGLVTNWPGSLKITPRHIRKGRHNFCGTKTSFWFTFHGQNFYGYQIGVLIWSDHFRIYSGCEIGSVECELARCVRGKIKH